MHKRKGVCGCELERREGIKLHAGDRGHAAPESQMN